MIHKNRRVIIYLTALLLLTSCHVYAITKKRKSRRFKTRPLNRTRDTHGHFACLISDMLTREEDFEQYFKFSRLTPNMFKYLLEIVGPRLQKDPTKNPLSPEHRLIMTLNYLVCGGSMQSIAWNYRVGKATVHCVIKETCVALWETLLPIVLPEPSESEWSEIASDFYRRWNMPNCIGALDGKHVNIQSPKHSGSQYFNYKKTFSIVLMAVCDSQYRFTLVDVGAFGSTHDSLVFKNSGFGESLMNEQLNLPSSKDLPGTQTKLDHFLVADQAFPLHRRIMRPYPGQFLGEKKNISNYRLSRARRTIENTFGILVQRWRILRSPIIASVEMCENIVKAAIVMHNFVQKNESALPTEQRKYCPAGFADFLDENGDLLLGSWRQYGTGTGLGPVTLRKSNNAKRTYLPRS